MQHRLLAATAAMFFTTACTAFAAEPPKGPEAKAQPAASEPKMVTYLGVMAFPAGAALEHQIGLPRGVGLLVEDVASDSPAASAGIARYDVLGKLDDQLLIGLKQLRVLVRMHKPGDQVKLTYYRNGKPETAAVTLGSIELKEEREACRVEPWHFLKREMSEYNGLVPWMGGELRHFGHEMKEALEPKGTTPEAAPAKSQTALNVNIVNDKYAITVDYKDGQEFATVKTADGKVICKDLPQAKWSTLSDDVRNILKGVQLHVKGGMEIKIEA